MDALDRCSSSSGDRVAYTFLADSDSGTTPTEISFGLLRRRARALPRQLVALNARGERALEQLAAFDFALALFIGLNNCLGIQPIAKYGKTVLKARLLPGLAQWRELAAFGFEAPAGTPPTGMAVRAHPAQSEESWQLFGTKYFAAAGYCADGLTVFARHEKPPGSSAFVVSEKLEGVLWRASSCRSLTPTYILRPIDRST